MSSGFSGISSISLLPAFIRSTPSLLKLQSFLRFRRWKVWLSRTRRVVSLPKRDCSLPLSQKKIPFLGDGTLGKRRALRKKKRPIPTTTMAKAKITRRAILFLAALFMGACFAASSISRSSTITIQRFSTPSYCVW